jgi:hypothetical protein
MSRLRFFVLLFASVAGYLFVSTAPPKDIVIAEGVSERDIVLDYGIPRNVEFIRVDEGRARWRYEPSDQDFVDVARRPIALRILGDEDGVPSDVFNLMAYEFGGGPFVFRLTNPDGSVVRKVTLNISVSG